MSVLPFARLLICSAILSLPLAVSAAEPTAAEVSADSAHAPAPDDAEPSLTDTLPMVHLTDAAAPADAEKTAEAESAGADAPVAAAATAADSVRPLTIAYLMPSDESPVLSAAKIVGNGLIAANRSGETPANIMLIETSASATVLNQIEAALYAGADVVIGPLEKNRVEELAAEKELPLPVVALNVASDRLQDSPSALAMLSISTEVEAEYVARLAVKALPETTERGEAPKVIVLKTEQPWEERISAVYEKVLADAGVQYEVFTVTMENLQELQTKLRPSLSEEDLEAFLKMKTEAGEDEKALKAVDAAMKAKAAVSEPPCQAALLALDARTASIVRNRLPLRTRVWATSTSNPGDPKGSSSAAALAFDLNNVAFTECPLVLNYSADSFEARFATTMPYSLPAKRLFALGADVLHVAQEWARGRTTFSYVGETGTLNLDRSVSALIDRVPAMAVVLNGEIVQTETVLLEKKGDMPKITLPTNKPVELTPVSETLPTLRKSNVVSVTAEEMTDTPLPPTPMLPKLKPVAPATPTAPAAPAVPAASDNVTTVPLL